MREINSPKVYLIAKTSLMNEGLSEFLNDIGNPKWSPDAEISDGEKLVEAAGRICYRSWQEYDPDIPEGTNPNVERVRAGSKAYIGNILEHEHGSTLEHTSATFLLRDVSRVVTHELVRHRAGMAFSQESLRYVRLDNLGVWLPEALKGNTKALKRFQEVVTYLEGVQKEFAELFDIKNMKDFSRKKKLTSMFRRLAPIGLGTSIMVTGNLRAWRHIIAMRTSTGAEEEIRLVIGMVAEKLKAEFPLVFQDMSRNPENGEWVFQYKKV